MSHDRNFELHLLYQEDDGVKPTRRRVTAHRRVSFLPRLLARGYVFVGRSEGGTYPSPPRLVGLSLDLVK